MGVPCRRPQLNIVEMYTAGCDYGGISRTFVTAPKTSRKKVSLICLLKIKLSIDSRAYVIAQLARCPIRTVPATFANQDV